MAFKKKVQHILLLCLVLLSWSAAAQISFGVSAGPNLSILPNYDAAYKNLPYIGVQAGFWVQRSVSKFFGIETGIFYVRKGLRYVNRYDNAFRSTTNLNALELPLMATFTYQKKSGKWMVAAGLLASRGLQGETISSFRFNRIGSIDTERQKIYFDNNRNRPYGSYVHSYQFATIAAVSHWRKQFGFTVAANNFFTPIWYNTTNDRVRFRSATAGIAYKINNKNGTAAKQKGL